MPQVKGYGAPQETLKPLAGPQLDAPFSADTFGAAADKALTAVGSEMFKEEMQRQDQVATLEADRKLSEWENKTLYDPTTGAMNVRGKDAFGLPDTVGKQYQDFTQEVRKGLTTDRQRAAYDRAVEARRRDINTTLSKHVFTEARKFEETETDAYIKNSRDAAALNYQDPDRIATEVERQQAAVIGFARRNNLGPEYIKQKLSQVASDTHGVVIDRFLANGQDLAAKDYFTKAKPDIAGDDVIKIEAKLKVATTEGEGQRGATAVWDKLGPKSDLDPINLDKMADEARAKFGDNPTVLKSVTEHLKERANIHNAAQRERREANSSAVWKQIDANVPLRTVAMSPEFLALPGHEQRQIREHVINYDRQQADQQGDDGLYYQRMTEASTPALREDFIKHNLMEDRPKLSRSMFNHLTQLQASMRQGDDKTAEKLMASERQQSRMVDEALISMKLDPTPNEKTPKDKAEQIAGFRRAVREAVRGLETRTGKNANDADVQSIVDGLMIEGVTKKGMIFDDRKRVYQLQPGEGVTVKVTDVPRAERDKIEAALRNNNKPINDDTIVKLYQEKLLRMRGLPQPKGGSAGGGY